MFRWFIVTSAINVSYNNSNVENRFLETCQTLDSIRNHCENTKIVLLEGSPKKLEKHHFDVLMRKTNLYIQHHENEMLQRIHHAANGNMQYIKSPGELFMLMSFLRNQTFIIPIDRVFKISGRHFLNDNFNQNDHLEKDTIVIKNKEPSVTYFKRETGEALPKLSEYQYKTRLYSFCGSLVPYMISRYESMFHTLIRMYSNDEFTDIEHIMYHVLQEKKIKQIPIMGLSGSSAENGQLVNE